MATGGKRDPSSHRSPAQVQKLSRGYNATPEQIKKRSMRNQARAEMEKKVGAAAIAGKDIDHKKPLRDGGSNAAGNLRIRAPSLNRGWEKDR
jgi:hypothetical protein